MSITGDAGRSAASGSASPSRTSSAGMFAAQGITMALLARARTGRGQRVDVGMLDSTAALLTYQAAIYFATGARRARLGNRHPTIVPYETFARPTASSCSRSATTSCGGVLRGGRARRASRPIRDLRPTRRAWRTTTS